MDGFLRVTFYGLLDATLDESGQMFELDCVL